MLFLQYFQLQSVPFCTDIKDQHQHGGCCHNDQASTTKVHSCLPIDQFSVLLDFQYETSDTKLQYRDQPDKEWSTVVEHVGQVATSLMTSGDYPISNYTAMTMAVQYDFSLNSVLESCRSNIALETTGVLNVTGSLPTGFYKLDRRFFEDGFQGISMGTLPTTPLQTSRPGDASSDVHWNTQKYTGTPSTFIKLANSAAFQRSEGLNWGMEHWTYGMPPIDSRSLTLEFEVTAHGMQISKEQYHSEPVPDEYQPIHRCKHLGFADPDNSCMHLVCAMERYGYGGWGVHIGSSEYPYTTPYNAATYYNGVYTWGNIGYGDYVPPAEQALLHDALLNLKTEEAMASISYAFDNSTETCKTLDAAPTYDKLYYMAVRVDEEDGSVVTSRRQLKSESSKDNYEFIKRLKMQKIAAEASRK